MLTNSLGKRLKAAREENGLTQQAVCEKINIQKSQNLSAYERDINEPPLYILKDLALLYGVTTDWLLFGDARSSEKKKSKKEHIGDFLAALDALGFKITEDFDWNGNPNGDIIIRLSSPYSGIKDLFSAIVRFGKIKSDIEPDEYDALVQGKIERIAKETNDFEAKKDSSVEQITIANPYNNGDNDLPF